MRGTRLEVYLESLRPPTAHFMTATLATPVLVHPAPEQAPASPTSADESVVVDSNTAGAHKFSKHVLEVAFGEDDEDELQAFRAGAGRSHDAADLASALD